MLKHLATAAFFFFAVTAAQAFEPTRLTLEHTYWGMGPNGNIGWDEAAKRTPSEVEAIKRCSSNQRGCSPVQIELAGIYKEAASMPKGILQLALVNTRVNERIQHDLTNPDQVLWTPEETGCVVGQRWTSAFQSFEAGCGNCKNYTFPKAAVLFALGYALEDVLVVITGVDDWHRMSHAYLIVRLGGKTWFALDNTRKRIVVDQQVSDWMTADQKRFAYAGVYVIDFLPKR